MRYNEPIINCKWLMLRQRCLYIEAETLLTRDFTQKKNMDFLYIGVDTAVDKLNLLVSNLRNTS